MKFTIKKIYIVLLLLILIQPKVFARDNKVLYTRENISNYFLGIISAKNYDDKNSVSKTVRKPETILPKLLTIDGKIAMRNIWDSIKTTETKNNGRINKDIILLKVLK